MPTFQLATFRADVTAPVGHPLCGGWYDRRAEGVTDPLAAIGVVLVGDAGGPVVLCALDWCEISHADHLLWRAALARTAGTHPDRVAVNCIHTHEAPWPDRVAHELVNGADPDAKVMLVDFCDDCITRTAGALGQAMTRLQPVTHLGVGQAQVYQVASNRRILGPDGKIKAVRWTATRDPAVRAEPEGLIDPILRTISFWKGDEKLAAIHHYATHPNSYGGDGQVSCDFAGLARQRLQEQDAGATPDTGRKPGATADTGRKPGATHIYLTGCAGNVTAGKYNDGNPANRPVLAGRLYDAMVVSEAAMERTALDRLEWRTLPVFLPPREDFEETRLLREIADRSIDPKLRIKAAMHLSYLRQTVAGEPTLLTCLMLGGRVAIPHLPGEPFIEYQFHAQAQRQDLVVAATGYGDCSVGYVPLERSYEEGGYEPTDAFVSPRCEDIMREAIACLMAK